MKIQFQDLYGNIDGHVELIDGKLVGDTEWAQEFANSWGTPNDTPEDFMRHFADYSSSFLYSKAV